MGLFLYIQRSLSLSLFLSLSLSPSFVQGPWTPFYTGCQGRVLLRYTHSHVHAGSDWGARRRSQWKEKKKQREREVDKETRAAAIVLKGYDSYTLRSYANSSTECFTTTMHLLVTLINILCPCKREVVTMLVGPNVFKSEHFATRIFCNFRL